MGSEMPTESEIGSCPDYDDAFYEELFTAFPQLIPCGRPETAFQKQWETCVLNDSFDR